MLESAPEEKADTRQGSEASRDLRKVEVLQPLPEREIERLASQLPTFRLDKGHLLFTPEHRGHLSFFVLEGSVRIFKAWHGWELTIEVMHAGEMFFNSTPGSVSDDGLFGVSEEPLQEIYAQAMSRCRIAMIRHEHFGRLVKEYPEVGLKAMTILGRRLACYGEKMMDIGTTEIPKRLARLIVRLVETEGVVDRGGFKIPTRYTHEDLASMICSRRVAVTRALGELKGSGVQSRRRYLYVSDLKALKRAAA